MAQAKDIAYKYDRIQAQLATGLATSLASGGNMGDTGAAVSAGKNAVENNFLSDIAKDFMEISKQSAEVECARNGYCQEQGISNFEKDAYIAHVSNENLQKINETLEAQAEGAKIIVTTSAALATMGGSLAAGTALSGQGIMIGLGVNGTYQVATKPIEEFSFLNWGMSGLTGGLSNQGLVPIIIYSTTSAAFESSLNGEKLGPSMAGATVGSVGGNIASKPLGPVGGAMIEQLINDLIKNSMNTNKERGKDDK
ncbi:VENN motif pre-toxin domain-containing protein [Utexia brackfieldae]|uniref:VENN motif pre-toxin domain-containing protein n=1 Tax=Utexia brackfieldae TaxID=3074108 RepID=UPI00370D1270